MGNNFFLRNLWSKTIDFFSYVICDQKKKKKKKKAML